MKLGDVVKIKRICSYEKSLDGVVGIVVEFVPTTPSEVTGEDICRVLWPSGFIDQVWRKGSALEVISESG